MKGTPNMEKKTNPRHTVATTPRIAESLVRGTKGGETGATVFNHGNSVGEINPTSAQIAL